jgi:hypothetical protein
MILHGVEFPNEDEDVPPFEPPYSLYGPFPESYNILTCNPDGSGGQRIMFNNPPPDGTFHSGMKVFSDIRWLNCAEGAHRVIWSTRTTYRTNENLFPPNPTAIRVTKKIRTLSRWRAIYQDFHSIENLLDGTTWSDSSLRIMSTQYKDRDLYSFCGSVVRDPTLSTYYAVTSPQVPPDASECSPLDPLPELSPPYGIFTYYHVGNQVFFPWASNIKSLSVEESLRLFETYQIFSESIPIPVIKSRSPRLRAIFGDMPLPSWIV